MSNIKEYQLNGLKLLVTDTKDITNQQITTLKTSPICSRVLAFANALFSPLDLILNKREFTILIESPNALIKNLVFRKNKNVINSVIDVTNIETQDDANCNKMEIIPLFKELGVISIISENKQIQEKMVLGNLEMDIAVMLKKSLDLDLAIWSDSKIDGNKIKTSKSLIILSENTKPSKEDLIEMDKIINSINSEIDLNIILLDAILIKEYKLSLGCDHTDAKFIYAGKCLFCKKEVVN